MSGSAKHTWEKFAPISEKNYEIAKISRTVQRTLFIRLFIIFVFIYNCLIPIQISWSYIKMMKYATQKDRDYEKSINIKNNTRLIWVNKNLKQKSVIKFCR